MSERAAAFGPSVNSTMNARRRPSVDPSRLDNNNYGCSYAVALFGATGVGKTAIIARFLTDTYDSDHLLRAPTIEDLHEQMVVVNGKRVALRLVGHCRIIECLQIDTGGSYSFPAMERLHMARADAFVLVYTKDDVNSVELVKSRPAPVK